MSKIFEALRNAQRARAARTPPGRAEESPLPQPDRRRSQRWLMCIPVFVYGYATGRQPFHEETYTLQVSEHGGLLLLAAEVRPGHRLLVSNRMTRQEQECRVVRLGTRRDSQIEVGITFPLPEPDFWRISPPPRTGATPSPENISK